MKGIQRPTSIALANNHHEYTSPVKYASSSSRKHLAGRPLDEDDEWIMDIPKRRPPRGNSFSEKKNAQNAAVLENDVNRIIRSVAEESGGTSQVLSTPIKLEIQSPVKKPPPPTPTPTVASPVKNAVIIAAEPKPVSSSGNEGSSPSKRSVQIKGDIEKKKPLQVSQSKQMCGDLVCVLVASLFFSLCFVHFSRTFS